MNAAEGTLQMNLYHKIRQKIRRLQKNRFVYDGLTISQNGRSVTYEYHITGEWKQYFKRKKFAIDYGLDVSDVPESVLIIPLLANVLPISWLCDAEIILNELESSFYDSIEEFKDGYKKMYPMLSFRGKLIPKNIRSHTPLTKSTAAMFFSAGVDSFDTLLSHKDEKPLLITLWGSDICLTDTAGWQHMLNRIEFTKRIFGCNSIVVRTNFREFLRENALTNLVASSGDGWWHGFQHGIGIICHALPYAYKYGFKNLYIASSFTKAQKGKITCASDPSIDEKIHFLETNVIHDGYELDRLSKVRHIVNYGKESNHFLPLHVCWEESGGQNCSHCEKCSRTILEIYACKGAPENYGFNPSLITERVVANITERPYLWKCYYLPIVKSLKKAYTEETIASWAKWIFNINLKT